jgi:hypothetical protein
MGFLGDWLDFAKFNVSDQWRKVKEDPERPFIGAMDQAGSKVWGTLLGKDYEPMTDWYGGAPFQTYDRAEAKGINTKPFGTGQTIANAITSLFVGGYGAEQLGGLGAGAGGASEGGGGILSSLGGEGGGSFIPSAGSGANFGIDAGGSYGMGGGGGGYGADIFGGYSPTGSDAGFSGSQLSPSQTINLNSNPYTPEYLNQLAEYNNVDAGNPSYYDRLTGNTEQGLYNRENLAQQASGNSVQDLLKKQAQQKAISQLGQSGSKLQEQNTAQQAEQNKIAQLQAMMRKGQNVDVVSSLLALLQDREQQSKQPRISLI